MTEPITLDITRSSSSCRVVIRSCSSTACSSAAGARASRALKNVTVNEPFFPGPLPHRPVMPGVMIIEALAQAAGILAFVTAGVMPDDEMRFYFVGIDRRASANRSSRATSDPHGKAGAADARHLEVLHGRTRR